MPKNPQSVGDIPSVMDALRNRTLTRRFRRLTVARARSVIDKDAQAVFVLAESADADALTLLRAERRSYHVAGSGETYLAPQLPKPGAAPTARRVNPFARSASRVCRLLLLHPQETFTLSALAAAAEIDKSFASQVISTLAADGYVSVKTSPVDDRARAIRVSSPIGLLEEWRGVWRRRRPVARRFDIGTRTVDETLRAIRDAGRGVQQDWAVGGLAGASFGRRVIEPGDVLLLTTADGAKEWAQTLLAEPNPDRGLLRIAAMPDPFVFRLSRQEGLLRIADPVQLWLDTATAGERAAAAAAAVADEMRW